MAQQRRQHVVPLDEPVGRVGYQSVVAARLVLDGSGFALEYTTSTEDNVRDPFTFSPLSWQAVDDQGHHYTAHEAGDWSINDMPPVREVRFRGAVTPDVRWLDLQLTENESSATIRIVLSDGGDPAGDRSLRPSTPPSLEGHEQRPIPD